MAVADTAMLLLALLTGTIGLAVGCAGVVVVAVTVVIWLPQVLLYWEWREKKEDRV
jgi:hypothetical protein